MRKILVNSFLVVFVAFLFFLFFGAGYFAGFGQGKGSVSPVFESISSERLSASISIVSVTQRGKGSVNGAVVEIVPGSGKILFSINPFVEPDTQDSVQTAAFVAQEFTRKSLSDRDIVFSIEDTLANLVGGPSAGAAFTVAAIAAIEGKAVRGDAAITGTILHSGKIGEIGGVIEKATAAAENGLKLFVVPKGQKRFTYYEQRQERSQKGNVTIIRTSYVPHTIDLQEYIEAQGFEMRIAEAENIGEAVELLLQ